jgi:hypothetical protein
MKADDCVHHWQIEISNGPWSKGTCKHCGNVREFANSVYVESQHITLERERVDVVKQDQEARHRWNRWFGG